MIRLLRELRLIPILLVGAACLFGLKLLGLMFNGSYVLSSRASGGDHAIVVSLAPSTQELASQTIPLETGARAQPGRPSWMQEMFGFPDVTGSVNNAARAAPNAGTVTGSVATPKPATQDSAPADKTVAAAGGKPPPSDTKPPMPETKPAGLQIPLDGTRPLSAAERAILERLQERRLELEKRTRELDMRENMLKEAEARLEARMTELRELEARNGGSGSGLKREDSDAARFKSLATMYENMKPKDAARIFDRLDIKVLIDMASLINPRRMADILAQMSPEAAERLTSELANRANGGERMVNPAALPKIEGRPSGS
ncbi:MAG TPA: flagellar protein FlbB [Xanthobacteraceae bacterium]|nr:flagellar protein FlbB [Xanthobacteraceae bacterium]